MGCKWERINKPFAASVDNPGRQDGIRLGVTNSETHFGRKVTFFWFSYWMPCEPTVIFTNFKMKTK